MNFHRTSILSILFLFTIASFSINDLHAQCMNEGLDFDGVNDYVSNSQPDVYSEFTISAWFNSSSNYNDDDTEDRIFSFGDPRLEIGLEDNVINTNDGQLWVFDEEFGTAQTFSTANLNDDSWHHVAITKLGTQRSIYLDGILISSWTAANISYGDGSFLVGTWLGAPSAITAFKGQIDEFAFFNRALTSSEISDNYNCQLTGTESNLLGYYPFENGVADADNTGISTTPNAAPPGWAGAGTLNGFALMGSTSNFICSNISNLGGSCVLNCGPECDTTILNLSTGYDVNGNIISTATHTSKWRVVGVPPTSGITPGIFLYILNTPPDWTDIPGAQYISPFPVINNTFDNIADNSSFDFETCFCVCDDASQITIDLSAFADNALNLDLYDDNNASGGSFIMDLLDISAADGTAAFNGDTYDATHVLTLDAGQYCLLAQLQNDGTRFMGLSLNASVTGAGLIKAECCGPISSGVTGFVYDDKNCNGQYDINFDGLISGAEITVCDDMGVDLATVITDNLGLYTFDNLGSGNFSVKYTMQADYEVTESPSAPVTLEDGQVIGGLNFGLNYTGPITVEPFNSPCAAAGGNFTFEWCGQTCDCMIEILSRPCNSADDYELIDVIPTNDRSYTWSVPQDVTGDFEFMIRDCDDNEISFAECLSIVDYDLSIQVNKIDCGIYEFSSTLNGTSLPTITGYNWQFGAYLNSNQANPTQDFPIAGSYQVCLSVDLDNECNSITTCQNLEVTEGTEDECCFEAPNVLSEIELGDLYIYDKKYGLILQSPNGSCFRIKVNDNGSLSTEPITCPE